MISSNDVYHDHKQSMNPQGFQHDLESCRSLALKRRRSPTTSTTDLLKTGMLDFAAGTVAGGAGVLSGYPLDTIRVLQQAGQVKLSVAEAFGQIWKQQGPTAFFRGVESPLGSVAVLNALVFSCYGQFTAMQKKFFKTNNLNPANIFVAGTLAGSIQAFITCPFEHIKIRMQQSLEQGGKQYSSTLQCSKEVYRMAGIKGLFRGFSATLLRDSYSYGVYFACYELIKKNYSHLAPSSVVSFFAGGIGGAVGWFICYPVDLVKTRLQSDSFERPQYRGLVHCAVDSYRQGGPRIFTRGLGATLVRSFLVDGVIFVVYDWLMDRMVFPGGREQFNL